MSDRHGAEMALVWFRLAKLSLANRYLTVLDTAIATVYLAFVPAPWASVLGGVLVGLAASGPWRWRTMLAGAEKASGEYSARSASIWLRAAQWGLAARSMALLGVIVAVITRPMSGYGDWTPLASVGALFLPTFAGTLVHSVRLHFSTRRDRRRRKAGLPPDEAAAP